MDMKTIRMEEMNWPDIKAAMERGFTTVVVGVGSTEQHGPHLPTMTDERIGDALANRVAVKLGGALQARTIAVGISGHHLAFGGTLSLQAETLRMIIRDYVDSLVQCGFEKIIFLPSHGGNFVAVQQAITEAQEKYPQVIITGYTDLLEFVRFSISLSVEQGISAEESGAHAGEQETSLMMVLAAGLVRTDRFEPGYLGPCGETEVNIILEHGMPALTTNGVLGDPRRASAVNGERYLERLSEFLSQKFLAGKPAGPRRPPLHVPAR